MTLSPIDGEGAAVAAELLPCPNPWCESHPYGVEGKPTRDDIEWLDNWLRVSCHYCHLAAPHADSEAEAIAAWNTRAPVAAQAELLSALEEAHARLMEFIDPDFNKRAIDVYARIRGTEARVRAAIARTTGQQS